MTTPPLAILGGTPRFATPRHVGRPNIGDRAVLHERLDGILDRLVLSNAGPLNNELEARIRAMTGARNAIAVTNATVGLELVARALGLAGEVILPSFTFIATAHALRWAGLDLVFADVDDATLTIDPAHVERLITPRTSAIVAVHLWGRICDTERLEAIAARHGLPVLYDAAHAFGCGRDGRMVGTFGRAEVFSFHATKFVNAFEGGAITTDDDELAHRIEHMRNFGIVDWDATDGLGTNAKMHEMSAAMGLTSLEAMPAIVARNEANLAGYAEALAGIPGLRLLGEPSPRPRNAQHVVVRIDRDAASLDRNEVHRVLEAERVLSRRYFHPGCHRMEPYRSMPGGPPSLPVTEHAGEECLSLPTGTAVSAEDIAAIAGIIRTAMQHAAVVRAQLAALPDD